MIRVEIKETQETKEIKEIVENLAISPDPMTAEKIPEIDRKPLAISLCVVRSLLLPLDMADMILVL